MSVLIFVHVLQSVLTCDQVMLQQSCSLWCAELLDDAVLQYEQE